MWKANVKTWFAILVMLAVAAILTGLLVSPAQADFELYDNQQIIVNTLQGNGILWDSSQATIVSGGNVGHLDAYNSSIVNVSGGSVSVLWAYNSSIVNVSGGNLYGRVCNFNAYNSSTVNVSGGLVSGWFNAYDSSIVSVSGGEVYELFAFDSSIVNVSGGEVDELLAFDSSIVNVSGGREVVFLYAYNSSIVNFSGGEVGDLYALDSSIMNVSGGYVSFLGASHSSIVEISGGTIGYGIFASGSSTVTFFGQDFSLCGGLSLDGNRLLGTGILGGNWTNGTPWTVCIEQNDPNATILILGNEIKICPIAGFDYSPEKPMAGEKITFDASSSYDPDGQIVSYEWDFGDGNSASNQLVTHAYTKPGEYTITLTVTDDDGLADTISVTLEVKGKEFMITFDDGPVPGNTENIVDALKNIYVGSEPVRAGFFMVGCDGGCEDTGAPKRWYGWLAPWELWRTKGSVHGNSDIVKYVADAGHIIGNHTQHHMWFGWFLVNEQDVNDEIVACNNELKFAPKILRPPYFVYNAAVKKGVKRADPNLQIIMGAGDNQDAATGDLGLGPLFPPSVLTVKKNAASLIQEWDRDYPCVLTFHDISPTTADNIAEIIRYLCEDEGFTLVHFDPKRLPKEPDSVVHHASNTIHQSEIVTHTVSLDSTVSTATFNVSWGGSDIDLVLYKPDGAKIDSNSALVDPNIKYAERDTYEYYTVSDPNPGNWIMEVLGVNVPPEGEKYTIRVEADTNLALFAFADKPDYGLNEQVNIRAQLVNDENSVTDALVTAKIQRPDGPVDNLTLYDDGTHGDEDPNDGFYANAYNNTSLRGSYEITVSAIGELTGEQYERASSLTVMVGSIIYGNVDFSAYAVFADHWLAQNCTEPSWCDTADLDQSGEVDIFDMGVLAEHWLEGAAP